MSDFTDHYNKNRAAFNARRREKYRTDKVYRERVKKHTATYRATQTGAPLDYKSIRMVVKGKTATMWTMGKVCQLCARSPDSIRRWEATKLIPKPTLRGSHRVYSMHQIRLIKRLSVFMRKNVHKIHTDTTVKKACKALVREIKSKW